MYELKYDNNGVVLPPHAQPTRAGLDLMLTDGAAPGASSSAVRIPSSLDFHMLLGRLAALEEMVQNLLRRISELEART